MVIAMMITMMILMLDHDDNEQRMKLSTREKVTMMMTMKLTVTRMMLGKIPTREKVTGMKCMFLPPSRVSSGLSTFNHVMKFSCEKFTMTMGTMMAIIMIIMMITIDLDCSWRQK